jgi:hypothetical protein
VGRRAVGLVTSVPRELGMPRIGGHARWFPDVGLMGGLAALSDRRLMEGDE